MTIPMMQRSGYVARALIAATVAFSAAPALADFGCPVRPSEYLGVDGGGFLVMIGGKHVKVCSFQANAGDASPDICKIWYSHVATARAQAKTVNFLFHETQSNGATSCAGLQDWALTPPYFLEAY